MKPIRPLLLAAALLGVFARGQDSIPPFPAKPVPKAEGKRARNAELAEWNRLAADTNHVVLDVRTPEEFAAGHMPGAVNIDFRAAGFADAVAKLDRNRTYLVHCAVGGRSAKACTQMDRLDLATVNLLGGLKAWEAAGGKPVKGK